MAKKLYVGGLPYATTDSELRDAFARSEEHTSELQSPYDLVCCLLIEKKKPLCNALCGLRSAPSLLRSSHLSDCFSLPCTCVHLIAFTFPCSMKCTLFATTRVNIISTS